MRPINSPKLWATADFITWPVESSKLLFPETMPLSGFYCLFTNLISWWIFICYTLLMLYYYCFCGNEFYQLSDARRFLLCWKVKFLHPEEHRRDYVHSLIIITPKGTWYSMGKGNYSLSKDSALKCAYFVRSMFMFHLETQEFTFKISLRHHDSFFLSTLHSPRQTNTVYKVQVVHSACMRKPPRLFLQFSVTGMVQPWIIMLYLFHTTIFCPLIAHWHPANTRVRILSESWFLPYGSPSVSVLSLMVITFTLEQVWRFSNL